MPSFRAALRRHLAPKSRRESVLTAADSVRPMTYTAPATSPIYLVETPVETSLTTLPDRAPLPNPDDRYGDLIDPQNPLIGPAEAQILSDYLDQSQAAATRRAYQSDWADFTAWCATHHLAELPASPQTVARYLADLAGQGRKVATLTRRLSAISQAHQASGQDSPTTSLIVRKIFAGIKRKHGIAQLGKAPLLLDDLRLMLACLGERPADLRDKAILLLGFAGAFRRSEIVSLDVTDLQERREGLIATLRHSKTDQEGQGTAKGIPKGRMPSTCPVRAVQAWLTASGLTTGPLLRAIDRHGTISPNRMADFHVARLIKRLALAAGLDATLYSGHSLRAGLATAAAAAGVDERAIMRQTGHRSERMVRRYIRDGALFRENAAGEVGL